MSSLVRVLKLYTFFDFVKKLYIHVWTCIYHVWISLDLYIRGIDMLKHVNNKYTNVFTLSLHVHPMLIHVRYKISTCFIIYIQAANIIYTSYTGHLSDWAWHTLETHVHTLYVHGMYMVYDLHTVCKHHIYNASCSKSSFLYIDCLDLSRPYSYLSELAIRNYLESGQSMSGSVQVVRILWLFSFSGKYIYIRVNTLYIHVFTRKTEKS